jgi:hypothetical protein
MTSNNVILAPSKALLRVCDALEAAIEGFLQEKAHLHTFEPMLSSIGGNNLYSAYIELSQYTHGGHAATWLYRRAGVGTLKEVGEYIQHGHWILPLRICWLALCYPGDLVTARVAQSDSAAWAHKFRAMIDALFKDLAFDQSRPLH